MKNIYTCNTSSNEYIKKGVNFFSQQFVKDVVIGIQSRGGSIDSVALTPISRFPAERLLVVYDDNGNAEEIDVFLKTCKYQGPED